MKLRQSIEDFKVEEVNEFKVLDKGSHKLYLLEKRNMETFSLLKYLSKKNRIPANEFGIAGLKDKHAVSKQYFTLAANYDIRTLKEQNFTISFLGFVNKPIEIGDLKGNRFEITVRDITKGEIDGIRQKAETIPLIGVPNYFDSQRFGSVIHKQFIAKSVIRKDYEDAVKLFLTQYTRHEKSKAKEEKRFILQNWSNIKEIKLQNQLFREIADEYKRTDSWLSAYKQIPRRLREMFLLAYQSYLWNECIKEVLRKIVKKENLYPVQYNAGRLLFYKTINEGKMNKIPLIFRTISHDITPTDFEKEIIDKVLSREILTLDKFDVKSETGNFFRAYERKILVKPDDFRISEPMTDELNDNRFRITLSFSLQKGSYATIITKRIFNK
jgi:tRNA pseudouridine13 synthase